MFAPALPCLAPLTVPSHPENGRSCSLGRPAVLWVVFVACGGVYRSIPRDSPDTSRRFALGNPTWSKTALNKCGGLWSGGLRPCMIRLLPPPLPAFSHFVAAGRFVLILNSTRVNCNVFLIVLDATLETLKAWASNWVRAAK